MNVAASSPACFSDYGFLLWEQAHSSSLRRRSPGSPVNLARSVTGRPGRFSSARGSWRSACSCSQPVRSPRTDRVRKTLRQTAPLAFVLRNVQDGIKYLQIRELHIPTLTWQTMLDFRKLSRSYLHASILHQR